MKKQRRIGEVLRGVDKGRTEGGSPWLSSAAARTVYLTARIQSPSFLACPKMTISNIAKQSQEELQAETVI